MSKCKACGAEIIWIRTSTGKMMPCNAVKIPFELVNPGTKGALMLVEPDGKLAAGVYDPEAARYGYESHFATCPAAAVFRRERQ